jgi:hypothetical protein
LILAPITMPRQRRRTLKQTVKLTALIAISDEEASDVGEAPVALAKREKKPAAPKPQDEDEGPIENGDGGDHDDDDEGEDEELEEDEYGHRWPPCDSRVR